jgi:hypothetical protein
MSGGLNRLLAAAVVAGAATTAALAGPSAALACNSGTSAVNVYKECLQGGGGGTPTAPPATHTGNGSGAKSPPVSVAAPAAKALKQAGKDKSVLTNLVKGYGLRRHLQGTSASDSAATPSAVGSAFDLGSGPTALLIVLVGTAALILGGSGVRVWRTRHRA